MTHRFLTVLCPKCETIWKSVHFAPKHNITTHNCLKCGTMIDLTVQAGFALCQDVGEEHGRLIGQLPKG